MKSEKGITLVSMTVYVIAMVIAIVVISSLTGYYYKNVDTSTDSQNINTQYIKFNRFFSEEVNTSGNIIIESNLDDENNRYIIFANKNQYTFIKENKSIYFNNVKIASNIEDCIFTLGMNNGKNTVTVNIKGKNFDKTTVYTLRN